MEEKTGKTVVMNTDLVHSKIENIRHCLSRIRQKKPSDVEKLKNDYDLQDIISVNLERAVQISVDLAAHLIAESERRVPDTMGQTFDELAQVSIIEDELASRLSRAVGFRNISVHEYQSIDWDIVFAIVQHHLSDFEQFIQQVVLWQEQH